MEGIQFEEQEFEKGLKYAKKRSSPMAAWMVRSGYAKDEPTAKLVLWVIIGVCILISVGIWAMGFEGPKPTPPVPQELIDRMGGE